MKTKTMTKATRQSDSAGSHRCPDCSGMMVEMDRVKENGYSFIWYECLKSDCYGQWLEKRPSAI